jgi:hypothetical protein
MKVEFCHKRSCFRLVGWFLIGNEDLVEWRELEGSLKRWKAVVVCKRD